jgi:hypothetical protein
VAAPEKGTCAAILGTLASDMTCIRRHSRKTRVGCTTNDGDIHERVNPSPIPGGGHTCVGVVLRVPKQEARGWLPVTPVPGRLAHNRLRPGLPSQRGWTVINCSQRPISRRDNTNNRACPTVPVLEWTVTTIVAKGTVQATGTSGSGNTASRCDTQCTPGLDVPRAALATVTFPRLQQARSWTVAPRPYCNKTLR